MEKAAQVAVMHEIYTGADMVLVWLGAEVPQDAFAFSVWHAYDWKEFRRFASQNEEILHHLDEKLQSSSRCLCCGSLFGNVPNNLVVSGLQAMADLLKRSWFSRLWVVQEVNHTATVGRMFSGSHSIAIDDFITGILLLQNFLPSGRPAMTNTAAQQARETVGKVVHDYGAEEATTLSFWRDFTAFSTRLCSDPRDRVYAIPSCLRLEHVDALRPNYSISAEECFRRLTYTMLQENGFASPGSSPGSLDAYRANPVP